MKKYCFFILILIFLSFNKVSDAQELSLSLNPTVQKIISKPGKQIRLIYTIKNTGDPTTMKVVPYIIEPGQNLNKISPISESQKNTYPHLEIVTGSPDDSTFLILAGESREFAVIIDIPTDVTQKDYYFSIVAESIPSGSFETNSKIDLLAGVGSNIYLSVTDTGTTDNEVEIALFGVHPTFSVNLFGSKIAIIDSFKNIPLSFIVVNKGKNNAQISASLESGNFESDNRVLAKSFVLAGSQKSIMGQGETLAGRFIGNYKLNSKVTVNNSNVIYSSSSFIVFPIKYFSILLTLLIVIIYIALSSRKKSTH